MSRSRFGMLCVAALSLLPVAPVLADDLRSAESFLCAAREVHVCALAENCRRIDPAELNVPDFLEIDLVAKELRTTPSSGENRTSPVGAIAREGGRIVLQGVENGRAWSFLIDEATGQLAASVAREAMSVSAFGVCTPFPAGRP